MSARSDGLIGPDWAHFESFVALKLNGNSDPGVAARRKNFAKIIELPSPRTISGP